jgi:asparagine synthase (glutamine-hydrolysing)
VVSGVGGDEVMGGVLTPIPGFQDLLVEMQFTELARELTIWALRMKKNWYGLLWQTVKDFIPCAAVGISEDERPLPWLKSTFVKRHRQALAGYPSSKKLFGALPSFQENKRTLDVLRRQLACTSLPFEPPYEKRYPYIDRDLLDFVFAIPADQLVRPTQSRSLMRRALAGIVPDEILNRKMKAFVCRAPLAEVLRNWPRLAQMTQAMTSDSLGIIDSNRFSEALLRARSGKQIPIIGLLRTIRLEGWLTELRLSRVVNLDAVKHAALAH